MKNKGDKNCVPTGLIAEFAVAYGCNSRTIRRIGATFRAQISRPRAFDFHRRRQGICGRRPNAIDEMRSKVLAISPIKQRTIRELVARTDVPKSTIFLHMRGMGARRMGRWIKPCIMQEQRLARLR